MIAIMDLEAFYAPSLHNPHDFTRLGNEKRNIVYRHSKVFFFNYSSLIYI